MEKPLLNDPQILPDDNVLESVLGDAFPVYVSFFSIITSKEVGLVPEWRYYKDGGAWLCKVQYKKKTVFWLSVWDKYFKVGFYFTEKHLAGFDNLPVNPLLKEKLILAKHIGVLIPLAMNISDASQLDDFLKIVEYKKKLK